MFLVQLLYHSTVIGALHMQPCSLKRSYKPLARRPLRFILIGFNRPSPQSHLFVLGYRTKMAMQHGRPMEISRSLSKVTETQ